MNQDQKIKGVSPVPRPGPARVPALIHRGGAETRSDEAEVMFFGCQGQAGHYLWSKKRQVSVHTDQPWGTYLDTGILLAAKVSDRVNGFIVTGHKDGWTCINFWDRSGGDTRPGCHSAFLVAQEVTTAELLELARQTWPEVFNRPRFPIA